MRAKQFIPALILGLLGLAAQPALASTATYYMDQSNVLADGVNYGQVDVTEHAGALDFTVTSLAPTGWRFQNFYFNLASSVGAVTLSGLPTDWSVDTNQNVSEFGLFSDGTKGNGSSRQSAFTFSVASTAFALVLTDLAFNSAGNMFAAHQACGGSNSPACSGFDLDGDGSLETTSHHIADGMSAVPLPAAAWLFGSVLLGFVSLSNRRTV